MASLKDRAAQERLLAPLFQEGRPVFALLDAARGRRVYEAIRFSDRPFEPLYDGVLSPETRETAPYLVDVSAGHPFTARLLSEGWGESWGFFIAMPSAIHGLGGLRSHLRQFLRAQTEDGRTLLFRFYDPRVLRAYLPTCNAIEVAAFFGPIERFVVEEEGGATAITFARAGAGAGAAAAATATATEGTLSVSRLALGG